MLLQAQQSALRQAQHNTLQVGQRTGIISDLQGISVGYEPAFAGRQVPYRSCPESSFSKIQINLGLQGCFLSLNKHYKSCKIFLKIKFI